MMVLFHFDRYGRWLLPQVQVEHEAKKYCTSDHEHCRSRRHCTVTADTKTLKQLMDKVLGESVVDTGLPLSQSQSPENEAKAAFYETVQDEDAPAADEIALEAEDVSEDEAGERFAERIRQRAKESVKGYYETVCVTRVVNYFANISRSFHDSVTGTEIRNNSGLS